MEQNNNVNEIDVRKIVRVVLEHWWWFVIGVVVCLMLGVAYYMRKTPTWKTDAGIMLREKENSSAIDIDAIAMLGIMGNTATEDEVVVLSSRGLIEQAIDALDIWDSYAKKGGLRWQGEFKNHALTLDCIELNQRGQSGFTVRVYPSNKGYKIKTKMGRFRFSINRVKELGTPIETCAGTIAVHENRPLSTDTIYAATHKRRELVVASYRKMINVAQYKKESNVITLTMKSTLPERDRALLHQLIEQYNLNSVVDKNMIATSTAAFIEERLNIITRELSDAEHALANYKEQNKIADINTQAQLFLEASSEEQRALTEVETQLSLVDYIDEFLRDETKRNNLIPSNIGVTDASLSAGLSEYNALQLQRMRILRTATNDNPVIEQMNAQLASMRQNIIESIGSVRESLKIRQSKLQAQDSKYNRKIKEAPEQEREYVRAVRDQQIKEQLYLFLYQKREENALRLAATSMPAKIVDMPQRDVTSAEPKLTKILMLCFLLGLFLPAGLLYLFVLFNDKIDDPKEFERRINAPMLGKLVQNHKNAHIAIHEGESTTSAELFRSLRTNMRFVLPSDVKSPVILVTSTINGDGKS